MGPKRQPMTPSRASLQHLADHGQLRPVALRPAAKKEGAWARILSGIGRSSQDAHLQTAVSQLKAFEAELGDGSTIVIVVPNPLGKNPPKAQHPGSQTWQVLRSQLPRRLAALQQADHAAPGPQLLLVSLGPQDASFAAAVRRESKGQALAASMELGEWTSLVETGKTRGKARPAQAPTPRQGQASRSAPGPVAAAAAATASPSPASSTQPAPAAAHAMGSTAPMDADEEMADPSPPPRAPSTARPRGSTLAPSRLPSSSAPRASSSALQASSSSPRPPPQPQPPLPAGPASRWPTAVALFPWLVHAADLDEADKGRVIEAWERARTERPNEDPRMQLWRIMTGISMPGWGPPPALPSAKVKELFDLARQHNETIFDSDERFQVRPPPKYSLAELEEFSRRGQEASRRWKAMQEENK